MEKPLWWQRGLIYQVYPRSFQDTDGDGVGDLSGIAGRLDYLVTLGIDALWLSPIQPSPMADFGYDISDYCNVDPLFGTLADFDRLLADAHARGLRLILDFVPNHTSERHPWFVESRRSRDDARRDWYIWRPPGPDGGPPNNWLSRFGGSAWERDEATGDYYLHSFLKQQPDLNWRNPAVRSAMMDALRFWLDRGVDGFRMDVLWVLIKDDQFRDNPVNPAWKSGDPLHDQFIDLYTADRPEVQDIVAGMRSVIDGYPGDRVMIGEIYLPVDRLVAYYGTALHGAQLPFNFQLINAKWDAATIADIVRKYEAALPAGAWPNWVLGNHDQPRIASRVGSVQARVAAMLLLTLRGTPTLYYGDEIGMRNGTIPPELVQDPAEKIQPGIGLGRDPQRTPMQWDASPGAGFTVGRPWLPIDPIATLENVAAMSRDPGSIWTLHHALIALRRDTTALSIGALQEVEADGSVLRFSRVEGSQRLLILLNMGDAPRKVAPGPATILLSTYLDRAQEPVDTVTLRPGEGLVLEAG
ncbi:MAG TPA: alpha-amylase family glycosyl hydrolase [Aliidongia sp.]|uniref:alpha-amylase family glycosyl hydrolase n=1 Tax=Aliidongia sp. TaxID=1914230 RepID=UPI002DDCB106|nr:alpha-amylase family glycosyl hydrolase [Aliidongia sp.]HEV2672901.1 alpha-amylase family glycosyl hydrolase [Aliidongia sp.]